MILPNRMDDGYLMCRSSCICNRTAKESALQTHSDKYDGKTPYSFVCISIVEFIPYRSDLWSNKGAKAAAEDKPPIVIGIGRSCSLDWPMKRPEVTRGWVWSYILWTWRKCSVGVEQGFWRGGLGRESCMKTMNQARKYARPVRSPFRTSHLTSTFVDSDSKWCWLKQSYSPSV